MLVALAAGYLFGGSDAGCAASTGDGGPELRCELAVGASPEAVWAAFTRTEVPRPFYFDAILQADLRPGGRWRFVTDDRRRLLAEGEILAVDAPVRFSHTFAAADLSDPPSRITVEIATSNGGSRVTLVHDGFERRSRTFERFRRAHPLALSALRSHLETGELPLRARLYTVLFKPGMKLFTVRAEPWRPGA